MPSIVQACVVPIRKGRPPGKWTQASPDNLLSWMSCVWPTALRQKTQQCHPTVLYCLLGWCVENAEQVIANQNTLRRIVVLRHRAGIWTGVKPSHNTSVCLYTHTHTRTHTLSDITGVHTHSAPSAAVTAVWQQPKPTCVSIETESVIPLLTLSQHVPNSKLDQYCFSRDEHCAYGAW